MHRAARQWISFVVTVVAVILSAEAARAGTGMAAEGGSNGVTIFDTGSDRLLAPQSITFSVVVSSCQVAQGLEFRLNGVPLGTLHDAVQECGCYAPLQTLTIDDPELLRSAWKRHGGNVFRIIKDGPGGGIAGTSLAWAGVTLEASDAVRYECLYDADGGGCTGFEVCGGNATAEAVDSVTTVIDPLVEPITVLGSLNRSFNAGLAGCSVDPPGVRGYFSDLLSDLFPVDLQSRPPVRGGAIGIPAPSLDLPFTGDGRFVLACAWLSSIAVIDAEAGSVIGTYETPEGCTSIDVCEDGTVLVASNYGGTVRRMSIDDEGRIRPSKDRLDIVDPLNVYCAPRARTGVVITGRTHTLESFRLPRLAPIDSRQLEGTEGVSGAFGSGRFYARSNNVVEGFEYDERSGVIGPSPSLRIPLQSSAIAAAGLDWMVLDAPGARLIVPQLGRLDVFATGSGRLIQAVTAPTISFPSGTCLNKARGPVPRPARARTPR